MIALAPHGGDETVSVLRNAAQVPDCGQEQIGLAPVGRQTLKKGQEFW